MRTEVLTKKVNSLSNGYYSGLTFSKRKEGYLVADLEYILKLARKHFSKLLVPDISDEIVTEELVMNEGVNCHPPEQYEVRTASRRLKNYKAAVTNELQAELFQSRHDELSGYMPSTHCQHLHGDWSLSVLYLKKRGSDSVR